MGIAKKLSNLEFEDPETRAYNYHKHMSNEQITIGAILEMQPGTKDDPCWVNGEFTAVVESSVSKNTKSGTPYVTGKLADPDTGASISFSWFGRKSFPSPGSTVLIGGNGISLGEYNGTPQLTFGKSTTCNTVAQGAPLTRSAAPGRAGQPPARQNAGNGQGNGFLGVTVGMAVNNSALDMRALPEDALDIGDHEAVGKWVWQRASVYLRVAASLEAGKLSAAGTSQRREEPEPEPEPEPDQPVTTGRNYDVDPPPQRPPARSRPAPTQSGQAFDNTEDDSDVPF